MSYLDCCDWNECNRCGTCLSKCPVMKMKKKEAKAEIARLLDGERPERVFSECTLCMNCNAYCPKGLRPYELILGRIAAQKSRQASVPALVPYFLQGAGGPNFFQDLYANLGNREQEILEKWREPPPPSREVLWIGCIGRMFCGDLENSRVLADLPKFSPRELCCGELHYRTGQWDAFAANTERLMAGLNRLKTERLVCYCGSCATYLGRILPEVAGVRMPFEIVTLFEWLLDKHEKGELAVKRPLNFEAAMNDSCYGTELGEKFGETLRKLYRAAGARVVELPHNREDMISCGAASIARDFKLSGVIRAQARKLAEVKGAGVRQMALNCPGCHLTLAPQSLARRVKLRYMPEELLRAFGDDISFPMSRLVPLTVKALARRAPLALKKADPAGLT